jgi:CRP-like cAMP-binding protein
MATSDTTISFLRRVPQLAGLTDDALARLASVAEECDGPEGTVLTREGASGRTVYVILDGWAAVTVGGKAAAAVGPGEHIGEGTAGDGRRVATVTAKTAMRVLVVEPQALLDAAL